MARIAAWVLLLVGLAALSGCVQRAPTRPAREPEPPAAAARAAAKPAGRYSQDRDSSPDGPPPDVSKIPEPVPKIEPRSQYGNKSPYTVLGETYQVLPSAKGYAERGIASWYGNKFHGYTTSTFEKYDMYAYSAAHKTLPLPSYARVTNLDNGRSVIVRVNDRGPFAANRIIDLSYVAAVKLGIWQKGTGLVEVRAIDPAHPDERTVEPMRTPMVSTQTPTNIAAVPEKTHKPALYLQIGAYADGANAERAAAAVRAAHLGEVHIAETQVNTKTIRRVRIGPLKDADAADQLAPRVRALGLGEPRVAIED